MNRRAMTIDEAQERIQELTGFMDAFAMIGRDGEGWQQMVAALAYEAYFHQTSYRGCKRTLDHAIKKLDHMRECLSMIEHQASHRLATPETLAELARIGLKEDFDE